MKEKEKRTAGSGGRLARGLLLTVLFMILSAGLVAVPTSETQAASTTKKDQDLLYFLAVLCSLQEFSCPRLFPKTCRG